MKNKGGDSPEFPREVRELFHEFQAIDLAGWFGHDRVVELFMQRQALEELGKPHVNLLLLNGISTVNELAATGLDQLAALMPPVTQPSTSGDWHLETSGEYGLFWSRVDAFW